jgi:hypothetical protein
LIQQSNMWIPVQGVTLIQHVRTPVSQQLLPPLMIT